MSKKSVAWFNFFCGVICFMCAISGTEIGWYTGVLNMLLAAFNFGRAFSGKE